MQESADEGVWVSGESKVALKVGAVFDQDLIDGDGEILLEAGVVATETRLRELAIQGVSVVYLAPRPSYLEPYAPMDERKIALLFEDTPALISSCASKLHSGEFIELEQIDKPVLDCLKYIQSDPGIVLTQCIAQPVEDSDEKNVRLSALAMLAAEQLGVTAKERIAVGRAGMLCDVAQPVVGERIEDMIPNTSAYDRALAQFLNHPLRGAEMVREGVPGVTELEVILIRQMHEQCDGSGFPRGLQRHHLHPLSKLLNVVDAFLSLTEPSNPEGTVMPADALAYLVQHALYGTFDLDCVKALVSSAAIYPVGTEVIMNDASVGTVMRSTGGSYMEPIIQMYGSETILDLRKDTREIIAPRISDGRWQRLPKEKMHEILWTRAA